MSQQSDSPTPTALLRDLDLSNVETTPHVEPRIASPLPPTTLEDVHPQAQSPGTYPPGHIPSRELTTSRPTSIHNLFESYIDVLASTTPTMQYHKVPYFYLTSLRLRDLPGPPRNPLKGHPSSPQPLLARYNINLPISNPTSRPILTQVLQALDSSAADSTLSHQNPLNFRNNFSQIAQPSLYCPPERPTTPTSCSQNTISAQPPPWAGTNFALAPRKPRKDSRIVNNTLRPNVSSADWILAWTSPWPIERKLQDLKYIPLHILQQAEQITASGLTGKTKSSYAAGLLRWHQFCDQESIPEPMRMPVSEVLMAGFVCAHIGSVSGSTIQLWLSGKWAWHVLNRAP
ncbi:hypothetical protein GG344DRAFT_83334 [Lentinula edodes]|nr:hypothetical protein GG344DRAFT_83334 [Lentinula edodes]